MTSGEAYGLLESALQSAPDERAYFIRQALNVLPDDHPARDPLRDVLAADVEPEAGLRAAYGELPSGSPEDITVSGQTVVLSGGLLTRVEDAVARSEVFDGVEEFVEDAIELRLSQPPVANSKEGSTDG